MRSMCVGVAEIGVEHCSPAMIHKATFLFSRFWVTKSAAKVIKESVPLSLISLPACTSQSREPCVASACGTWQSKSRQYRSLRNLILPRVRTYHTRKPSRFVHALSARPLKKSGAGVNLVCALTKARIFASLLQREKVSATG